MHSFGLGEREGEIGIDKQMPVRRREVDMGRPQPVALLRLRHITPLVYNTSREIMATPGFYLPQTA